MQQKLKHDGTKPRLLKSTWGVWYALWTHWFETKDHKGSEASWSIVSEGDRPRQHTYVSKISLKESFIWKTSLVYKHQIERGREWEDHWITQVAFKLMITNYISEKTAGTSKTISNTLLKFRPWLNIILDRYLWNKLPWIFKAWKWPF